MCKGGCQKSLIFDWGIVFCQPLRSKSKILTTSPYTGEARASRSILLAKLRIDYISVPIIHILLPRCKKVSRPHASDRKIFAAVIGFSYPFFERQWYE